MWDHLGQVTSGGPVVGLVSPRPGKPSSRLTGAGPRSLGSIAMRAGRSATPKESRKWPIEPKITSRGPGGLHQRGEKHALQSTHRRWAFAADTLLCHLVHLGRRLAFGGGVQVLVSDTVGFVRDLLHCRWLPSATLEETIHSTRFCRF